MFKIIFRTDRYVHICSNNDFRIISIDIFERARTQKDRSAKIRKPVQVVIAGDLFIFKKNQWKKGELLAADYKKFCAGLPYLYKWEQQFRFKKKLPLKKRSK